MSFDSQGNPNLALIENGWFYEKNDEWLGRCNGYGISKVIALKQSKFQEILIFDCMDGSRVMVLDGIVQFDTMWEHIYHEMIVHVPLFAHPNPKSVLLIGGGDGGCIREIVKHKCVENVVWVEIDKEIIDLSKQYFPSIFCQKSCNDKRVKLMIDDGIKYVKEACKDNTFDIIIVDGTDAIDESPSAVLFTQEFYENCYRILKPGGLLNCQNDCLFETVNLWPNIKESITKFKSIFDSKTNGDESKYYAFYTPMYTSGQLGCVLSMKNDQKNNNHKSGVDQAVREVPNQIQQNLKYYSSKIHSSSFVLPYQFEQALSKL